MPLIPQTLLATIAGGISVNALLGLLAAAFWGGGDFAGSMAVKRTGSTIRAALQVVVIGHSVSLLALCGLAILQGDPFSITAPILWSFAGGTISGISLVAFYLALSSGHMGSAAAVSGLLCAALPAIASSYTEGPPHALRLCGFLLAGAAIWLIASATGGASRRAMLLSIGSGLGFGVYFIALKLGGAAGVLWPTAAARVGSLTTSALLLAAMSLYRLARPAIATGSEAKPTANLSWAAMAWIVSGAFLDLSGNLSFIASTRAGRLDVAAVLASIYPAGTILLAALILKERTSRPQKLGMLLALPAILLITL